VPAGTKLDADGFPPETSCSSHPDLHSDCDSADAARPGPAPVFEAGVDVVILAPSPAYDAGTVERLADALVPST